MHGYLKTTEAKLLHNELIRAIIHNAHFAMSPPQNVGTLRFDRVREPAPQRDPPAPRTSITTNTASDLHHLPSLTQLDIRIGILLNPLKLKAESKAMGLIFSEVKQYVCLLLAKSLTLVAHDGKRPRDVVVTAGQIVHAIEANPDLASVLSPTLYTKLATLLQ
jgi:hypothetical protein